MAFDPPQDHNSGDKARLVDAACRHSAIEAAIIITPPNPRPCFSAEGWRDQDHKNKSKQPSTSNFRTDDADPEGNRTHG
jgi:hypothetical protein